MRVVIALALPHLLACEEVPRGTESIRDAPSRLEWRVDPSPRVEIGVVDGADEYLLHDVTDAGRQSDGDLVVADRGAGTVRLYDTAGAHLRLLGRRGPGPGEFRTPSHVVIGPADSIWVWDETAWRLTVFESDGELTRVRALAMEALLLATGPPLYPETAVPLTSSSVLVRLAEKGKAGLDHGGFRAASGALRATLDGGVRDTVALFRGEERLTVEAPWGPWPVRPPLARSTLTAVAPLGERICYGDQAEARVLCRDGSGSLSISWAADEPRVDPAAVQRWREQMLDELGQKIRPEDARQLLTAVPTPDTAPEFTQLLLDGTGNLWVVRGLTGRTERGEVEAMVFRSDGHLLGWIRLPKVRVLEIGADYLLGVREDAWGVQFLGVYELDRSPR